MRSLSRFIWMTEKMQKKHIKGSDGLRALAALAVFGVHFNQVVQLDAQLGPFDLYRSRQVAAGI